MPLTRADERRDIHALAMPLGLSPGAGTGAAGRRVPGIRERGTSPIFYATYADWY